jgi:hypothetical protein
MTTALPKTPKRARDMGKGNSKSAKTIYTIQNAFSDISKSPTEWSDRTRKEYKARLLRITKIAMTVNGMLDKPVQMDSLPPSKRSRKNPNHLQPAPSDSRHQDQSIEQVDLVDLFGSVETIDKIGNAITQESRAKGTVKDYMQALSSLARKSSPTVFGTRFPEHVLEHVERMVRDNKSIRQVADVRRTFTDEGHEPYENIQAAGKWYSDRGEISQDALIVSLYADNPVYVRDNYGAVMMDYGTVNNKKYGVPEPDRSVDTYYDVSNGHLYITSYKNAKQRGHRPYDIKLSDKTRTIVDKQLSREKRRKAGYRHYLIHAPGDLNKPIGRMGGAHGILDKALRGAKSVGFKTNGVIGTNQMRSSYVTYRLNQADVTLEEMLLLAREMRHSFAVQQLVYKRLNS